MKGKMKKIIAGIATLAMAAQFAFVVPASAATLYSQDFESVTDASSVMKSQNAQNLVSIGTDSTKYLQFVGDKSTNSRSSYSDFTVDLAGKDKYVVEFDASLKAGNTDGSQFIVRSGAGTLPAANSGYASDYILKMVCEKNATTWTINDVTTTTVNITADTWYSFKLIVDTASKLGSLTIKTRDNNSTAVADKIIIPMNGDCTKISGLYWLNGRYSCLHKIDNIVVRETETTDDFGTLPTEELSTLEWTSQLNRVINQPAENEPIHIPITVKVNGSLGNELSAKSDIVWTVKGLEEEDGYISLTKEPGTELGTVGEDPTNSATAYFNVRNGVSNWYGSVTATVTYNGETKNISTPFAVIGASGGGDNIAPIAGYPEDMSTYKDDLVGYQATATGLKDTDLVLNNWSIYGSNGDRTLKLKKDEDGTKYLQFESNGGSGSTVGVYQLANQTNQYITDLKIRFAGGSGSFGHYFNSSNNGDNNSNWACSYNGGVLSLNGTEISNELNSTDWFRIVVSADESTKKCWAKVYTDDGILLGEATDISIDQTNATKIENKVVVDVNPPVAKYTYDQKYFCLGGTFPIDLASFRVYKPAAATVTVTGAESISVPGYDEKTLKGKGIEESDVYTYDATAHTLTVNAAGVDSAKLLIAEYDKKALAELTAKDLTFTSGSAVVPEFTLPDSCRLMLWKPDLEAVEPLKPVEGTGISNPNLPALVPATTELNAIVETSEGFEITGDVNWTIDSEDSNIILTPDKDDSHKATLTVKDGAPAGTVTVTASNGAAMGTHEIGLTSSGNSIATTATTTSLTIPFTGEEAVDATFTAKTVDKDGAEVQFAADADGEPTTTPAAITWSVLDKNLRDITDNMPTGVTWDATSHKITVTDQAKAAVIYVQAKNNDATPLSRNIKVNIHGMSFAFGTGEPAEGFTQVTAADAYTEKLGYGFLDASVVKDAATNVSGSADYRFKAAVPNGNYVVKVNTTSASVTSEVVESVTATTGITKSGSQFNVAVADGVLDLTFASGSTLSSIEIEQAAAKTAGDKPSIYAIGDSTTNNTGNGALSWGNYFVNNSATLLTDTAFGSFSNNGMAGRDSVNFYNQGRVETVLLAVRPGDYVTINMGINSKETNEGSSYETLLRTYYIDAVAQRGAIPVIVTATPDGPVGSNVAADYNSSTGMFTNNRGDGARNNVLRALAAEKQYNLIELGQAGEDWLNDSTLDELKAYGGDQDAANKLALVQSWYVDHNHYKEPMAKWISEYMIKVLDEIAKGSEDYIAVLD